MIEKQSNVEVKKLQHIITIHLWPSLNGIVKELRLVTGKLNENTGEEDIVKDWKFAAMVSIGSSLTTLSYIH